MLNKFVADAATYISGGAKHVNFKDWWNIVVSHTFIIASCTHLVYIDFRGDGIGTHAMANEIRNVFISHIHEDDDGLGDLKDLVAKHDMEVRDSSINSEKPNAAKGLDYIKQKILAPQIRWASTLVVYVTPDTKDSWWVNWEIEYANKLNKRIVGVWAHGENECDLPAALEHYADAVVGWHGESIVDAISGKSNESYDLKGRLREYRPIKRFSC